MKLSVSNIAWENSELEEHLKLLRALGCDGVELAPSCIWPEPVEASLEERNRVRGLIQDNGLEVTAFHALLYTRPDLQLFKDKRGRQATVDYLKQLAQLCADLRGKALIFGSPKSRMRGDRDYEECLEWAAEAFREVAEEGKGLGVVLCIEPLPPKEADFIRNSGEGMALVRRVNHPNFGLHLDAKAMVEAGENFEAAFQRYGREIWHFHVGDPGLSPPGSTGVDHSRIGKALRRSGYNRYVSIEMRRGFGLSREVISRSVEYVRACYLGDT